MSTAELKSNLHRLVVETDDKDILSKVEVFFQALIQGQNWWDVISDEERRMIELGKWQIDNGQGISHDQVRAQVGKLLERK